MGLFASVYGALKARVGDPPLLLTVVALTLLGIAMVYSAGNGFMTSGVSSSLWTRQVLWLVIAAVALVVVLFVTVQWLEWIATPAYLLSVALLAATLLIGTGKGTAAGTKSWIDLGFLSFQPAQFANVATILFVAKIMSGWRETPDTLWRLWTPILAIAVPMGLVLQQPDLGTAMVFGAVMVATLYWGGVPIGLLAMVLSPLAGLFLSIWDWAFSIYMVLLMGWMFFYHRYVNRVGLGAGTLVVIANLAAGSVVQLLWSQLAPYQQNRFTAFINPMIDPQGAGYQLIQSRVAIGSGGLFGKGFTLGTQKGFNFLPEPHTDFIFSVVGEEFGLLFGTLPVLLAYAFILWRLVKIAERAKDPFGGVVAFGIFGAWFAHILVNVGMTVGLMPITGIPLPFLSYGGTFLLANFAALAIVQRIAAEGVEEP
ncbi:MAG: rod shape-determining protein RodA [Gemmatimonadota bacterium]